MRLSKLLAIPLLLFTHLAFAQGIKSQGTQVPNNYDIHYERVSLQLSPDTFFIKGDILFKFNNSNNALAELRLDMSDSLQIDTVLYHGMPALYQGPQNNLLRINFLSPLAPLAAEIGRAHV